MEANNWKNTVSIVVLILSTFILMGCTTHPSVEIYMVNELQECEEENIHYTILLSDQERELEKKSDKIVLPELSDDLATKENLTLLWPPETKKRIKVKVKGYFKPNGRFNNYGCNGARVFVIEKIIEVEDVTKIMGFAISN